MAGSFFVLTVKSKSPCPLFQRGEQHGVGRGRCGGSYLGSVLSGMRARPDRRACSSPLKKGARGICFCFCSPPTAHPTANR
ncbi:hypothetical protein [Lysobacter gummosus]|uniref:hypothetical protein n=1 Tax=Lysobacter gummosus TaxID=262324 RepID=UPI00362E34F8